MSQFPNPFTDARGVPVDYESRADSVSVAQFFNAVYAWMATGLALTALVAWWGSTQPAVLNMFYGPARWVMLIVQIVLVIAITGAVNRISATAATVLFLIFAASMGLTMCAIFRVYSGAVIGTTFGVTAGTFAATSVYGFVTRTDLTRFGSFLFMALIGLVIASVVNIFWANPVLYWIVTYAGVLIFVGLTAYDTQRLKMIAVQLANDSRMAARYAIVGALQLYLDFINLFLFLLRILGDRRS